MMVPESLRFEFDLNDNVRPDNTPIVIGSQDLPEVVAQKIVGVVQSMQLNFESNRSEQAVFRS